jgi:hypothetical protein
VSADAHTIYTDYVRDKYPGGRQLVEHLDDGPWTFVFVDAVMPAVDRVTTLGLRAYPWRLALAWEFGAGPAATLGMLHLLPKFAYDFLVYYDTPLLLSDQLPHRFDSREQASRHWTATFLHLAGLPADRAQEEAARLGNGLNEYNLLYQAVHAHTEAPAWSREDSDAMFTAAVTAIIGS